MAHAIRRTLVIVIVVAAGLGYSASGADQSFAPLHNPSYNIPAVPSLTYSGECTHLSSGWSCANPCVNVAMRWIPGNNTPACGAYTLAAINHARRILREPTITLPSNWYSLSEDEQLFTIIDAERTTLGYPAYLGLSPTLSNAAAVAARQARDPGLAPGFAVGYNPGGYLGVGGTWAAAYNALEADYGWMYEDGWGGSVSTTSNIDCKSVASNGCWGHRDEILGSSSYNPSAGAGLGCTDCEVGAGFAVVGQNGSEVILIERPAAAPPAMSFTWASELSYFHGSLHVLAPPVVATTTSTSTTTTSTSTTTLVTPTT
jgi:hypothetical protein